MPSGSRRNRPPWPPMPPSPPPPPSMPQRTSPPPPLRSSPPPPPLMPQQGTSSHGNPQGNPSAASTSQQNFPTMPHQIVPLGLRWLSTRLLSNGQSIPVYQDMHGTLLTNYDGQIRPLMDVYNEVERERLRSWSHPLIRRLPAAPRAKEDQPTPHQMVTAPQNPEPTGEDPFNRPVAAHKLQMSQSSKDTDQTDVYREDTSDVRRVAALRRDVSSVNPTGLLIKYFVRVDKEGLHHIYPDRGGPFRSSEEAQEAIDSYHVVQRNNLCMDGLSWEERSVRYTLYWPHDGTRKNSAEAFDAMATYRPVKEVVKSLLDKYNEDNSRFGDLVYELEEIVSYRPCFDGKGCPYRSYSHLNMTMKNKGADNALFFAEVTCMVDEHEEYVLTCISAVGPDDNGQCHVCGDELKHPSDVEYKHGRSKQRIKCCRDGDAAALYDEFVTVHDEAWLKEQEAMVRRMLNKAIKADIIGDDGHRKSAKYVVPARRK